MGLALSPAGLDGAVNSRRTDSVAWRPPRPGLYASICSSLMAGVSVKFYSRQKPAGWPRGSICKGFAGLFCTYVSTMKNRITYSKSNTPIVSSFPRCDVQSSELLVNPCRFLPLKAPGIRHPNAGLATEL